VVQHLVTLFVVDNDYQGAFIRNAIVIAVAAAIHVSTMMVTAAMTAIAILFPCICGEGVGVSLGSESSSLIGNLLIDTVTPFCTL
jgi:hypothetical protein